MALLGRSRGVMGLVNLNTFELSRKAVAAGMQNDEEENACNSFPSGYVGLGADIQCVEMVQRVRAPVGRSPWRSLRSGRSTSFDQWFSGVQFDSLTDGVLCLRARDEFVRRWVEDYFLPTLSASACVSFL